MRRQLIAAAWLVSLIGCGASSAPATREPPGLPLLEIERSLGPLAEPLGPQQAGDWLSTHPEEGQTFADYVRLKPKRRSGELTSIYLVLLGDFSQEQREVLATAQEYLSAFYQAP